MAITINRNEEITNEEFKFLKQKFKEKTMSSAIYSCIEYVVHKVPDLEEHIRKIEKANNNLKIKHNYLIEIIKKKQVVDQELGQYGISD